MNNQCFLRMAWLREVMSQITLKHIWDKVNPTIYLLIFSFPIFIAILSLCCPNLKGNWWSKIIIYLPSTQNISEKATYFSFHHWTSFLVGKEWHRDSQYPLTLGSLRPRACVVHGTVPRHLDETSTKYLLYGWMTDRSNVKGRAVTECQHLDCTQYLIFPNQICDSISKACW